MLVIKHTGFFFFFASSKSNVLIFSTKLTQLVLFSYPCLRKLIRTFVLRLSWGVFNAVNEMIPDKGRSWVLLLVLKPSGRPASVHSLESDISCIITVWAASPSHALIRFDGKWEGGREWRRGKDFFFPPFSYSWVLIRHERRSGWEWQLLLDYVSALLTRRPCV